MEEINDLWLKYNDYANKLSFALGRTSNIVGEYAEYLAHRHWGLGSNGTENQRKHELEFALLVCDC